MGRGPSIEARKNAVDAQRGKIFTKVIREISVAARAGGGDPAGNPRLRSAIDKGLAVNMSKDVIERAIKKATGELEGVEYEEIRYEGYAPGGVAVIVDCLTDNRVRTVADVRHAFGKFGGNLGTEGSVAFMFRKLGVLSYASGADEEKVTEAAIEAGADDVVVYPEDGHGGRRPRARPGGSDVPRRQRHRGRGRNRAAGRQAAALAGRHGRRAERL
jgi:YebC/PmpR family DNA-binding regulatory protein